MVGLSAEQVVALKAKIALWRGRTGSLGPMHSLWDAIADAEALLDGRATLLCGTPAAIYEQLMAIR